jgi:hypothetical protein
MPLINREVFADAVVKDPRILGNLHLGDRECREFQDNLYGGRIKADRASALKLLDMLGNCVVNGARMGKGSRPWDIVPTVFDSLDRKEPWWGFEFETGWVTRDAYKEAVRHVWDNYDGCMFDEEGEGQHQVEITFCPAEMSKFLDGTAPAYKFVEWMEANQRLPFNGGGNKVGTHVNISDPRFGDNRDGNVEQLTRFLNRTMHHTRGVNGQRMEMFGRESIYAGFFHNQSNGGKNNWIEMKGFRTTYRIEEFKRYVKTCAGLQKVVDTFYTLGIKGAKDKAVGNLYDVVFNGAEPVVKDFHDFTVAANAAPLSTRYGGDPGMFGNI